MGRGGEGGKGGHDYRVAMVIRSYYRVCRLLGMIIGYAD